jgi:CBS-domain-containing membrane protein
MLSRYHWITVLGGAIGGAIAIAAMEHFSMRGHFPLFAVPFATSIVLVMGSPEVDAAQPRALIGGHLVATLVGLIVLQLTGPGPWAAAAAVGFASPRCI